MNAREAAIREAVRLAAETAVGAYAALLDDNVSCFLELLDESQQWSCLAETEYFDRFEDIHTAEFGNLPGMTEHILRHMDPRQVKRRPYDDDDQ